MLSGRAITRQWATFLEQETVFELVNSYREDQILIFSCSSRYCFNNCQSNEVLLPDGRANNADKAKASAAKDVANIFL